MAKPKNIEEQLREAVLAAGPYRRTGRLAGVDVALVSRFARHERTITLTNAAKLATALGLRLTVDPKARPAAPGKER